MRQGRICVSCVICDFIQEVDPIHNIAKITLRSADFSRTEHFYHELFGSKFHQYSSTYMGFEPPPGINGGFQRRDTFSQGDSYLLYILVEEFESYLRRIPELGGRSTGEIEVVSDSSQCVRIYDPDGNRLALLRDIIRSVINLLIRAAS